MHPVTFVVLRVCATSTFVQWNPGNKAMGIMTVFLSIQILLCKVCLALMLLMSAYSFHLHSVASSINVHWCTGSTKQVMVLMRTQGCGLCTMIATLLGHLLLTFSTSILWFMLHIYIIGVYGDNFLLKDLSPDQSLNIFWSYYVNKYIDHHGYEITF